MNLSSYINLCKPKIVALLTVTALIGMLLSVNFYTNLTNVFNGLASLVGFALLAAASAALNQIFDRETDKNMSNKITTIGNRQHIPNRSFNIYSHFIICWI